MSSLLTEIGDAINKHSIENESDTPDFILAEYLRDCLTAFATATKKRTSFYTSKIEKETE